MRSRLDTVPGVTDSCCHMMTEHPIARERRVEQRAHLRRAAPLRCWLAGSGVERFTRLSDLSLDGARILTAAPPTVGEQVRVRFKLPPTGREVSAAGRVVWASEGFRGRAGVLGVEFAEVAGAGDIVAFVEDGSRD